jgi:hypothetical protein
MLHHGVVLEEAVHVMDLYPEAIELLLQRRTTLLRLSTGHLQGNQPLISLRDSALELAAVILDAVIEAGLHLLQLIEEDTHR